MVTVAYPARPRSHNDIALRTSPAGGASPDDVAGRRGLSGGAATPLHCEHISCHWMTIILWLSIFREMSSTTLDEIAIAPIHRDCDGRVIKVTRESIKMDDVNLKQGILVKMTTNFESAVRPVRAASLRARACVCVPVPPSLAHPPRWTAGPPGRGTLSLLAAPTIRAGPYSGAGCAAQSAYFA